MKVPLLALATSAVAVAGTSAYGVGPVAQPVAGQVRTVTSTVEIGGVDHKTYVVTVTARQAAFVEQPVTSAASIGWRACWRDGHKAGCGEQHLYRLALTSQQLDIASDGSVARLLVKLGGLPWALSWSRTARAWTVTVVVDASGATVGDPSKSGPATTTGRVFGVACSGIGSVDISEVVDVVPPQPLPGSTSPVTVPAALRPSGVRKPQCLSAGGR
jgi:hypothetical protein